MNDSLPSWPRPLYTPGGGQPFILLLVFGSFGAQLSPSREKHRVEGVPPGLSVGGFAARDPSLEPFFTDPVFAAQISENPDLSAHLRSATSCMRFMGQLADQPTLDYLRDVVGLATAALDAGGIAVLDPQTLSWWSAQDFRATFFDHAQPAPVSHVAFLGTAENDGSLWLHTRGMRKFGRPDVSVHHVPDAHQHGVVELMQGLVQTMADGAVVPEGQEVRTPSLPMGMTCHHQGSLDDPDFNNTRMELRWPGS